MNVSLMVDRIAVLDAQIAELKTERELLADELKDEAERVLPAGGTSRLFGTLHIAVITKQERATVDWRTVAQRLGASRQLIAAHTQHVAVLTLKLVGINKAAA